MAEKDPTTGATGTEADPQLDLKKRARRRLVGAIALALLAVIVLPMVMDQEPKPVTQDIQIRIPSQDPGANSVVSRIAPRQNAPTPLPAESKPAPAVAAAAAATAAATATAAAVADAKPAAKPESKPEPKPEPKPETKPAPAAKPEAKSEPKPAAKVEPKPVAKTEAAHKPEPKTAKSAEKPAEKPAAKAGESARAAALLNDEHWVIQLGAYQDQGNVKVLQAKIKELGYAAFTEKVDTPNGARIRVRCGPFPSREAAEKAQARLKKIGAGGPTGGSVAQAK